VTPHAFDERRTRSSSEAGYTLIELMIAIAVMMVVSASIMNSIQQMTRVSATVNNRSEMHAGVRNATELLQQEIGQAGKISLPGPVTLTVPIAALGVQPATVSDVTGMFVNQTLTFDTGATQESVQVTAINAAAKQVTGDFQFMHVLGSSVRAEGGFFAGVVPKTYLNGSTDFTLKMFGDINGDGNMVYVEYICDLPQASLFRNSMPITAAVKPMPTVSQVLLNNIQGNPDGSPCFTYQEQVVSGMHFVTDVAITLTVQTEKRDPVTGLFQQETKALLNVSPRNVFQVWQLASMNMSNRVQSVPASVTALLP